MDEKPTNLVTGQGTKQVDVRNLSEAEQLKLRSLISGMVKLSIQHRKVLSVLVTFDVKSNIEVNYFGASPEITKRAKFLSDKIGDMIPKLMNDYDIPKAEVVETKIEA